MNPYFSEEALKEISKGLNKINLKLNNNTI